MIIRRRYSAITARRKGTHYFRLTAEEDDVTFTIDIGNLIGNESFNNNYFQYIEYSTNGGRTWVRTIHPNRTQQTITISNIGLNNSVLLRGSAKSLSVNSGGQSPAYNTTIKADKNFSVKGVLMTLLIPDADKNTPITDGQAQFKHLFHPQNSTTGKCIDAGDLIMPSGVTTSCYYAMFSGNSQLRRAPKLPATTLATNCYRDMFVGCTALTYVNMQALDISASNCLTEWLPVTMSNLEFHRNPGATWWVVGKNGIPYQSVLFDDTEPLQEKETFIDPEVQRIVIENWGNRKPKNTTYSGGGATHFEFKNGIRIGGVDGKVLKRQLTNVRTILTEFKGSSIVDFSDLATKFPNLYSLGAEWNNYYGGMSSCFQNCTSLKYITIPNTVVYLGAAYTYSNGCFQGSGIESIYIPDSVTTSGDHLFYNCSSLKTVRWSSNLPTRVNPSDFFDGIFNGCSNLETIENYPTTIGSIIPANNWRSCSKLDISQFYPLLQGAVNIGTGSISGTNVTNLPQDLILLNLVSCAGLSPGNLAGVGRRRLFLPKVTNISQYGLANNSASLIDLGNVTGTYFYPGNGNSSTNTVTVILRSTAVPTFSTFNKTNVRRIYVYQDIINDFITTYSAASTITYPIGGTEWIDDYGNEDEYADWSLYSYAKNTAPTRLDTGICANDNTKIEVKLWSNVTGSFYSFGTRESSSGSHLFSLTGSQSNQSVICGIGKTNTTATNFVRSSSGYTYTTTMQTNGDMTYSFTITDGTQTFTANNVTYSESLEGNDKHIYLFSNGFNDIAATIRFYYVKIWQNDTLVMHLKPCDINGTPCMLDMVTMKQFTADNIEFE